MRHAVLSDIHGNAGALHSVLSSARNSGAEALVLLGDHVGYYFQSEEVIETLQSWPHVAIRGNHDRMILEARSDEAARRTYHERYGSAAEVTLEQLSPNSWRWLEALPDRAEVTLGQYQVLACHGSPADPDRYVYPDAPKALYDEVCDGAAVDAVWMGHTHWPFMRAGAPWLLNPGSVGQPRDMGSVASWCLFDDETGAVAFRRTEFDARDAAAQASEMDPHLPRNADVFRRRRLDFRT